MRNVTLPIAAALYAVCGATSVEAKVASQRPNIIFILSDDVGFEEHGIYGVQEGKSITPNIDRMGRDGVAFSMAWGQSISGPSRSMICTGMYAANNGAYDNKLCANPAGKDNVDQFPAFTKIVKDAGYKTAVVGKWHLPVGGVLGTNSDVLGVDEYMYYTSSPASFKKATGITPELNDDWENSAIGGEPILSRYWRPHLVKNGEVVETTMKDYGPDIMADYVRDIIKRNAKGDEPFLIYHTMVLAHSSHCTTPYDVEENGETPSNKNYPSGKGIGERHFKNQLRYADKLVGEIIEEVKRQGIADNTIIIYASDNGTTASAKSKGVEYGVHIPFMVCGAGIKQRGMTDELMDFTDVLPTLAEFAGAEIPAPYDKMVDGKSMAKFLTGKSNTTKPVIYSQPGITSLVRTKDFLLEAVSPLAEHYEGRFYKTNGSFDGRGYENVTHDPKYAAERAKFEKYLSSMRSNLPTTWDDPAWKETNLKKGYKYWNNEKQIRKHHELPLRYKFYDATF